MEERLICTGTISEGRRYDESMDTHSPMARGAIDSCRSPSASGRVRAILRGVYYIKWLDMNDDKRTKCTGRHHGGIVCARQSHDQTKRRLVLAGPSADRSDDNQRTVYIIAPACSWGRRGTKNPTEPPSVRVQMHGCVGNSAYLLSWLTVRRRLLVEGLTTDL